MLNAQELANDLKQASGDHAGRTCQMNNVETYLHAISTRHKVAPNVEEAAWLVLLALHASPGCGGLTAGQVCMASAYPAPVVIEHISRLLKKGLIVRADALQTRKTFQLALSSRGSDIVDRWLALLHVAAQRHVF